MQLIVKRGKLFAAILGKKVKSNGVLVRIISRGDVIHFIFYPFFYILH